jgi:hypothetical protein
MSPNILHGRFTILMDDTPYSGVYEYNDLHKRVL